ncbi:hypothetical protein MAR_001866 [Mya arenaria]|uniref:Uncharacterized protein n=1 Tax=Mya arenaria TaxID=6604 RepID=A0ABY7FD05_MYAAR|nr:hypothetical protein MAR_001866 [Mya arenaria]
MLGTSASSEGIISPAVPSTVEFGKGSSASNSQSADATYEAKQMMVNSNPIIEISLTGDNIHFRHVPNPSKTNFDVDYTFHLDNKKGDGLEKEQFT